MGENRRNYYRVLHVQPEAPDPVITATYRTLMSKMRMHPDLGGDTASATLLNEAYSVLGDPERRARYDAELQANGVQLRGRVEAEGATTATRPGASRACLFCRAHAAGRIHAQARCQRCESPLAPAPSRAGGQAELFGRRAAPRVARTDAVTLVTAWQAPVRVARLRDLSPLGLSVITDAQLKAKQVIRVIGPLFDALATVADCSTDGRRFEVRAALLTAIFNRSSVFVSVRT